MYYTFTSISGMAFIVKLPENMWIPVNEENTDYQRYLAWVAEGNSPLPWPPVS